LTQIPQDPEQPAPLVTGNWGAGSYTSPEASLRDHFAKHGAEVGATTIEEYLRKAQGTLMQRRGRGTPVAGATSNVRRFDVHGTSRYIDVDVANNQIISFGSK
jgi:filamentous hemagglutinin